jgi:hypothetical protein
MSSYFNLEHKLRMDAAIPSPPILLETWCLIKDRDNFVCFTFIPESNARILNHRQLSQHPQIPNSLHGAFER